MSTENSIKFDRSYWPECGTIVGAIPADLNDIWENHSDQASIFVAEAIIADPPRVHYHGDGNIAVYLWSVGGDTLVIYEPLDQLIPDINYYDIIRSQEQADDVLEQIAALEKIEAAVKTIKDYLREQLTDWEKK